MPRRRGTYRIVPNAVRRSAALLSNEEEDSSAASAWQARYDKMVREQEAEEARRRSLHPTERLAEDGAKLRTEIESHDDMSVVLEVSASARAVCRAGRDCFYIRPPPSGGDDYYYQAYRDGGGGGGGAAIQDDFRIRVNGVRGELAHWRMHHFYHVLCFVAMMDVEELIPSRKFTFECGPGWGLMVRKWEKHRGRVDLDVLAKFIDDMEQWEEEKKEENSTSETSAATTSSTQEKKPVLRNYVTTTSTDAEAGANLWELMKHPHIWKGTSFILPTANGPKAYGPWAESWEEEEDLPSEEVESGAGNNQEGDTADDATRRPNPAERVVNSIGMSLREFWDLLRGDRGRSQDAGSSQGSDDGSTDDAGGTSEEGVQEAESKHSNKRGGHGSSGDERSGKRRKRTDGDDAESEAELEREGTGRVVVSE